METHDKVLGRYETCVETGPPVQVDEILGMQDEAVLFFIKDYISRDNSK